MANKGFPIRAFSREFSRGWHLGLGRSNGWGDSIAGTELSCSKFSPGGKVFVRVMAIVLSWIKTKTRGKGDMCVDLCAREKEVKRYEMVYFHIIRYRTRKRDMFLLHIKLYSKRWSVGEVHMAVLQAKFTWLHFGQRLQAKYYDVFVTSR